MSELTFSQRLRVHAAVSSHEPFIMSREAALCLARIIEREEFIITGERALISLMADRESRRLRDDRLIGEAFRSLFWGSCAAILMGWWIGGAI